ncbi:hypothetical protein [Nostocoides vanveenii]|uniref:Uncharacterized protein n=1 Tax=Nostocoides vanveenii TaxID=330835 RepID=A0ABP4XGB2_9MICO
MRISTSLAAALSGASLALTLGSTGAVSALTAKAPVGKTFTMVRSNGTPAACLPSAKATVVVTKQGTTEKLVLKAAGLRPNADYDLFVTQVPDAPFGVSWYQSDLHTDAWGAGQVTVVGRFNKETFSVAPGAAPAPVVHAGDAAANPAFAPVHQYHLGLWFNSPADAAASGCAGATTPFNGDHNAGVQILSTRNFPAAAGPLKSIP